MKTNKNNPSKNKRPSVSSDILSAMRRKACPQELHHNHPTKVAFPPAAGARYQIDSACLDMRATLPGAHRELGQAYLNIRVDSATGQIVDAKIEFGATGAAPWVTKCNPYRPQFKAVVERAFTRLLRHDQSN
jgi:hypothetical protein